MALIPSPYMVPGSATSSVLDMSEESRDSELTNHVNAIGMTTPDSLIEEPKLTHNMINLSAGEFPGFTLNKPMTQMTSISGSIVKMKATFTSTAIVEGVTFKNSTESSGVLIEIGDSAVVMFRNCHFRLNSPDGAPVWINIENGAKVIFVGCMWSGTPTSGAYLVHTGANANVQVVASFAPTTAPGPSFGNSTLTAVI